MLVYCRVFDFCFEFCIWGFWVLIDEEYSLCSSNFFVYVYVYSLGGLCVSIFGFDFEMC